MIKNNEEITKITNKLISEYTFKPKVTSSDEYSAWGMQQYPKDSLIIAKKHLTSTIKAFPELKDILTKFIEDHPNSKGVVVENWRILKTEQFYKDLYMMKSIVEEFTKQIFDPTKIGVDFIYTENDDSAIIKILIGQDGDFFHDKEYSLSIYTRFLSEKFTIIKSKARQINSIYTSCSLTFEVKEK